MQPALELSEAGGHCHFALQTEGRLIVPVSQQERFGFVRLQFEFQLDLIEPDRQPLGLAKAFPRNLVCSFELSTRSPGSDLYVVTDRGSCQWALP
jgi:hypothetical protein